jgi:hypothetical protein
MKKRILCRKAATKLDEMSKLREKEFDSKYHGESNTTAPSPKRRRIATGDAPATECAATTTLGLPFVLASDTGSTPGLQVSFLMGIILLTPPQELTSYSFNEFPQSNGHGNHFPVRNSELLTTMMTNDELVGQFGEQYPRAILFTSRTMDWNQSYFTKPQQRSDVSGQSTYSQSVANPFAQSVAADVDGSIEQSNTEFMALYGAGLAVDLGNEGPI